jgi:hypothetical protein
VSRGRTEAGEWRLNSAYAMTLPLACLASGAVPLAFYLLNASDWIVIAWAISLAVAFVAWAFFATWVYLAIEIFAPGKSNLARTMKYTFGVLSSLGLAGLGKWFYG